MGVLLLSHNSKTRFSIKDITIHHQERGVRKHMKNQIKFFALIVGLLFLVTACGSNQDANVQESMSSDEEQEVADDHRIVATTVALVEIMDELELDLVGVPTSYKDLPERYAEATEIGNPMDPDMEIVLSLKPTDVLSVTTLLDDLDKNFKEVDLPAHFVDLQSVDGMFAEIASIGEKYDRTKQAEELINQKKDKMNEIEAKVSGYDPPSVLILMGIPGSYIVGTENSYIGDLVQRAGGVNAVENRDEEYISANTEYLQQLEPDVILRAAHGAPEEVVKMFDREFKENDIWKHFKAVKDNRVHDLEETLFGTTANLAVDEALEHLVKLLHPDAE